jgi:hypothetical protein
MRLLETFSRLFDGTRYLHRKSNLGDLVAVEFYEDLVSLGKSAKLPPRIAATSCKVSEIHSSASQNNRISHLCLMLTVLIHFPKSIDQLPCLD